MSDFNITARDQLTNPGKIFEEITKFTPGNLKTSRSGRSVSPINLTTFNLSEILMRIPAFDSPENALGLQQGLVGGVMGSFWDAESMGGFARMLPPDMAEMLDIANPDGGAGDDAGGEGGGGGGGDGGTGPIGRYRRSDITPSSGPVPSNVQPVTRFAGRIIREVLGFDGPLGGKRNDPGSDHHTGHAWDVMVGYGTPGQKEQGDMIADYFYHNRDALGVKYVIWYEHIASSKENWKWRYYERGRGKGITWEHKDHPHISFRDVPAPNNPKLEWPDGYPLDTPSGSNIPI